jgi:hypothetical protein
MPFLESDTFKAINLVLFSILNGYVSTVLAIIAPSFVEKSQREQVGISVGIFMGLGILCGAIVCIPVGSMLPQGLYWK